MVNMIRILARYCATNHAAKLDFLAPFSSSLPPLPSPPPSSPFLLSLPLHVVTHVYQIERRKGGGMGQKIIYA
jgi:hypothetical protein